MSIPGVRRMVMFKHGVAYIERAGPAEGSFELSFKRDEMNDVLKSLAAWVARGDAVIGAIAFEKPEDPEEVLADRKLLFAPGTALLGLLGALRGRRVALDMSDGSSRREGDVVGVDVEPRGDAGERRVLLLRTAQGALTLVDLAAVSGLSLLEEPSRADLDFLVDRSRAANAGASRAVHVHVAGRADDLRISYVVPAPTWRVSYRLVREADVTWLTAWGIVHNPADEDLDAIELTLTTGQPISFLIDLYHPKNVARAVVEEETRAVAGPTRFERPPSVAAPSPASARAMSPPLPGAMAASPSRSRSTDQVSAIQQSGRSFGESVGGSSGAAEYADRGELFEYRVAAPISIKRGGSAMVPLLSTRVTARKMRVWRAGSPPAPDLVLDFANDTGAVLEEGPAVVYDDSVYAGEAMVPYSARGAGVKLGFAKDLGVRCRDAIKAERTLAGLRLGHAMIEEHRIEEHHELSAENDHADEVEVVFELPKVHGRSVDPAHATPFEETASFRRFRAVVAPRSRTVVHVVERWHDQQHLAYDAIGDSRLASYMAGRFLDPATLDSLAETLALWAEVRRLEAERKRIEAEQAEAYAKQQRLAEQLQVLKEGGAEGALRLRYVKELEVEQDKVNACETKARALRDEAEATTIAANERLRGLTKAG